MRFIPLTKGYVDAWKGYLEGVANPRGREGPERGYDDPSIENIRRNIEARRERTREHFAGQARGYLQDLSGREVTVLGRKLVLLSPHELLTLNYAWSLETHLMCLTNKEFEEDRRISRVNDMWNGHLHCSH